nr:CocE/NonD family hydrolase [Rhizorhabdus dicambivorans]
MHTVLIIPKGGRDAPILLTRTPYGADSRTSRNASPRRAMVLPRGDQLFTDDGYIRVYQDIRGKYGSQGDFKVTRPLRGALNDTITDESTDAWDTIEWLIHHVPESNGRVGMMGSSYDGFTTAMALVAPHPALKVAAPLHPMIDGWMGDDWFHNGAFRQPTLGYLPFGTAAKGTGPSTVRGRWDEYEAYLRAGSASGWADHTGIAQLPYWKTLSSHPAYDRFWSEQALDKILGRQPLSVPTLWTAGFWDQEDIYGAIHAWAALEQQDEANDRNYLVIGPWRHSQSTGEGRTLGPFNWEGDTALQFRRDILKPFFDRYLKNDTSAATISPVTLYNSGDNRWERFNRWPLACQSGCAAPLRPLYLQPAFGLSFDEPSAKTGDGGFDSYISDPAKPVPFIPRPSRASDSDVWAPWLVSDQRSVADRPDVLTYVTPVLTEPLRISGTPAVDLWASTSGTDSDWVVKLIDVFPDEVPDQPQLGGYQLGVSMEIFRGRYRESFAQPRPLTSNVPLRYRFDLPSANHVFLPGHRIMVQIQSSWFPLYDRNPQRYVDNIFFAKPGDFRRAEQRVFRLKGQASSILLPVVADSPRAEP